ncbi:unnamed protein product [Orchesella dallaii]|uniref:Uncharacterized protein n=1 Tax=Orchesella dallaii TaxID=48710 RepID=A0ABP1RQD5_9HEXA
MIFVDFGEKITENFEIKELLSKFQPLYPKLRIGIHLYYWNFVLPKNSTIIESVDLIEYTSRSNAVFVSYTIFEHYIDSIFTEIKSFITPATEEDPRIILNLEFNLRSDLCVNNETIIRYLCVQIDLMHRISVTRNIKFVINNLAELKLTVGISGLVEANLMSSCLPAPIKSIASSTYISDDLSPYRIFDNPVPVSIERLLVMSLLFNKTYSKSKIMFGDISSFGKMTQFQEIVTYNQSISSISSGLILSVKNIEDSYELHSFLLRLLPARDKVQINRVYMTVPDVIIHLNFRQAATNKTVSPEGKESAFEATAKEFKDLIRQLNATLIIFFDSGSFPQSILDFQDLVSPWAYSDTREVLKISDTLLWTHIFLPSASVPNYNAYLKIEGDITYINTAINLIGHLYPQTDNILGVYLGYKHTADIKSCQPKTGISLDEFFEFMYTWSQIYSMKITEMGPFSMFFDDIVTYGRWSVLPIAGNTRRSFIDSKESTVK